MDGRFLRNYHKTLKDTDLGSVVLFISNSTSTCRCKSKRCFILVVLVFGHDFEDVLEHFEANVSADLSETG